MTKIFDIIYIEKNNLGIVVDRERIALPKEFSYKDYPIIATIFTRMHKIPLIETTEIKEITYTEKDVRNALFTGSIYGSSPKGCPYGDTFKEIADNFIESLNKKSPKQVELECQYEDRGQGGFEMFKYFPVITSPETNSITPLKLIYE